MNYFFVTGSSKGIGESLVKELLRNPTNFIYGLSRTNSINNQRFSFIKTDLSKPNTVNDFLFNISEKPSSIVLINNAGIIGDIKTLGNKNPNRIIETYNVNTIAPTLLMNQFINQFQDINCKKLIINISSGAGRHSIASWSDYCASKSALDMCSLVVKDEQKNKTFPIEIISLAPGVIDTEMQSQIRASKIEDFDKQAYFVELKEQNRLSSPKEIAQSIIKLIENNNTFDDTILDLRN